MSLKTILSKGLGYVYNVKWWILLLLVFHLLLVVFPANTVFDSLRNSLHQNRAAENMLNAFDYKWYYYFSRENNGLATTFTPAVTGIGAVLEPLNQFLQGEITRNNEIILGLGLIYVLLWIFFSPGFISRFTELLPPEGFFHFSVKYFGRLLIISGITLLLIYLIFHFPFNWLSTLIRNITRETIDERVVFLYTIIKYLVTWLLILMVKIISDYARLFLVLREIHNPFRAIGRAIGFVFRNPVKVIGLYLLLFFFWISGFIIYWVIVPGAVGTSNWHIFWSILLGECFILFRMSLRLFFLATQGTLLNTILEQGY